MEHHSIYKLTVPGEPDRQIQPATNAELRRTARILKASHVTGPEGETLEIEALYLPPYKLPR